MTTEVCLSRVEIVGSRIRRYHFEERTSPSSPSEPSVTQSSSSSADLVSSTESRPGSPGDSSSPSSPSPPPSSGSELTSSQELEPKRTESPVDLASATGNTSNNNGSSSSSSSSSGSANGAIVPTGGSKQGWQNVSILIKKYVLLEPAIPANPSGKGSARSPLIKTYPVCLHLETREQFTCKVIERKQEGYDLLAVHHRVGSDCDEISTVHEVVISPRAKCYYMIMPATFGSVHNYLLHRKKFREAEAANIFKQMVKAVQHCHEKGVVLRDLKMGKFVFHDRERTLVRLDTLEDAVLLHDLSDDALDDKHGCPNYVSPEKTEILRSTTKKYPGKATDMWGLGVMLYAMLVGRYPFMDDDHSRLFSKIRNGRVTIPDHVSVHAKFLIRCLLHKDPSKRPTCGEILNHVWLRQHDTSTSSGSTSAVRPDGSSRPSRATGSAGTQTATTTITTFSPESPVTTTDQSSPASPTPNGVSSPAEALIGNSSDVKEQKMEAMDEDDQVVPNFD